MNLFANRKYITFYLWTIYSPKEYLDLRTIMVVTDIPVFEYYVRDCLAHLYDYNFLQEHPLLRMLVPHVPSNMSRVQAFQQLIFSAIERVKPFDQNDTESKNSRLYTILSLRYQHKYQVQSLLRQLNLGERQYYRDHTKAVQALAQLLEEQAKENTISLNSINRLSIQSELERVHRQSTPPLTDAETFLQKALQAIKTLSERKESVVTSCCIDPILLDTLDQTLMRQVIIWITSQLLLQAPLGSHVQVTYRMSAQAAQFTFTCHTPGGTECTIDLLEGRPETLETLLNTLGAEMFQSFIQEPGVEFVLEIPFQQHSILIIDDNPDAVVLFRQFLLGQAYQIFTAQDGTQAIDLAHKLGPKLIILDVLLPNQDGWEILQRLKNHPATMHIPIIICSVLDAADLAIMLGADAFMLKPPQEFTFLDTLRRISHPSVI